MITLGFSGGVADAVTLDTAFPIISTYIYVGLTPGDLVFRNSAGDLGFISDLSLGWHPIAATEIVTSGDVNGTPRTTTADGLSYLGSYQY